MRKSYLDRWLNYLKAHPNLKRFNVVYVKTTISGKYLYVGQAHDLAVRYSNEEDMNSIILTIQEPDLSKRLRLEKKIIRIFYDAGFPLWNKQGKVRA